MTKIGQGLAEFSTSIRLFVAAFWVAWICSIYSGDCIVFPLNDPYLTTSTAFLVATSALGATLLLAGIAPAPFECLLANGRALVGVGALAGMATVGIGLEGILPAPVFFLCALGCGAFTSILALLGASLFAELDTKKNILAACLNLIVGVLLYMLVSMCGSFYPPAVALGITALFPMAGVLLALVPVDAERPALDEASHEIMPSFWRILAFSGVLIFALSMVRGYFPQLMDSIDFAASRLATALGLIVMALLVLLAAARMPRTGSFGGLFYGLMVGAVVAILSISLLGPASALSGALGGVANGVVCMAIWCLLADLSFRTGMSAVRAVGFGYGVVAISMTLGFALGAFFGDVIAEQYDYVSGAVFLAASIACAVALLQRKALDQLLTPTPAVLSAVERIASRGGAQEATGPAAKADEPKAGSGESAAGASDQTPQLASATGETALPSRASGQALATGGRGAMASADAAPADEPSAKPGKFMQRCNALAQEKGLSARETEVFILLAKHMEAKAIAEELFISFNTVRTHIEKIYTKLDVHSRRELLEMVDSYKL